MKASDIFERIRNAPGVTVRTHMADDPSPFVSRRTGKRIRYAQLTPEIIVEIRRREAAGESRAAACRAMNVHPASIYNHVGAVRQIEGRKSRTEQRKKRKASAAA